MGGVLFSKRFYQILDGRVLRHSLSNFKNPNNKIAELIKKRELIRVKRDLYVPCANLRELPVSREMLANRIYAPSYISFDYALMKYGLIPERVKTISSVCLGRGRKFQNYFGLFNYKNNPKEFFSLGMSIHLGKSYSYLIATPEKALLDKVMSLRSYPVRSYIAMQDLLFSDLRIDEDDFSSLNLHHMKQLAELSNSEKVQWCTKLLGKFQK